MPRGPVALFLPPFLRPPCMDHAHLLNLGKDYRVFFCFVFLKKCYAHWVKCNDNTSEAQLALNPALLICCACSRSKGHGAQFPHPQVHFPAKTEGRQKLFNPRALEWESAARIMNFSQLCVLHRRIIASGPNALRLRDPFLARNVEVLREGYSLGQIRQWELPTSRPCRYRLAARLCSGRSLIVSRSFSVVVIPSELVPQHDLPSTH